VPCMKGNADFNKQNTCLGVKVSHKNRIYLAQGPCSSPQVYIGVCPSTDYTSTNWSAEVAANGVPPRCIAWGMGQDFMLVNSGSTRESYQLQPEGYSYGVDATVCMRVAAGLVEFYVEQKGTHTLVASVMFTDATLRPFVAVRGQEYQCAIVKATISTSKPPANSGIAPALVYCVACIVCVSLSTCVLVGLYTSHKLQ
jgi:hypothetical protein